MSLLKLPYELQLLILKYIKKENHLDLAPLAETCKFYSALVTDKFNWSNTVIILPPTSIHSSSLNYLLDAFHKAANKNYRLSSKDLQIIASDHTVSFVLHILRKQQCDTLENINITIPSMHHPVLYQTLSDLPPQTKLQHFAICDSTHDSSLISTLNKKHVYQFLSTMIASSQTTLKSLNLSSLPTYFVMTELYQYQFPHVTVLHMALVGDMSQFKFWRQLKQIFPKLLDLRLNISKDQLGLFQSLLNDVQLFPWIRKLSAYDQIESPKAYISRDELRHGLLHLNGLCRITAGWDMISLG